eukprot:6088642-Amphidinium_carterae.2
MFDEVGRLWEKAKDVQKALAAYYKGELWSQLLKAAGSVFAGETGERPLFVQEHVRRATRLGAFSIEKDTRTLQECHRFLIRLQKNPMMPPRVQCTWALCFTRSQTRGRFA